MEDVAVDQLEGCLRVGALGGEDGVLLLGLLGSAPGELTDGEVGDGLLALVKLWGQVDAALAGFTSVFEARTVFAGDGARSTGSWIAARSEITAQAATRLAQRARGLRSCPHVAAAYEQGLIGTAKVGFVLAAREGVESLFAEREQELVELIRDLTVAHARLAVAQWRRLALATAGLDEDSEPCDEVANHLHLSRSSEGRHLLSGNLDAVGGAELAGHVAAEVTAMFASGAFAVGDGLVASQRNARALCYLVARGADPATVHGEARPSVSLIWDAADLLGRPAETSEEAMERRAMLADGTPVPRSVAERLLREGTVRDVLAVLAMDGSAQVLGVSRASRGANARQRRALGVQDQGCVFPGCSAPISWTDAHHTVAYERTKLTDLEQLALLCRFHHHLVHEGGFTLARDRHGVSVRRPDGTLIPRAGPGRQLHEPTTAELGLDPTRPGPVGVAQSDAHTGDATERPGRCGASRLRRLAEQLDHDERIAEWHGAQTERTGAELASRLTQIGLGPAELTGRAIDPSFVDHLDLDDRHQLFAPV